MSEILSKDPFSVPNPTPNPQSLTPIPNPQSPNHDPQPRPLTPTPNPDP